MQLLNLIFVVIGLIALAGAVLKIQEVTKPSPDR